MPYTSTDKLVTDFEGKPYEYRMEVTTDPHGTREYHFDTFASAKVAYNELTNQATMKPYSTHILIVRTKNSKTVLSFLFNGGNLA